jgi:hypothetical protein
VPKKTGVKRPGDFLCVPTNCSVGGTILQEDGCSSIIKDMLGTEVGMECPRINRQPICPRP